MNGNIKNSKNKNKVGRRRYTPTIPKGKFSFAQFVTAQDGKCTPLTLRQFLARDKAKQGRSEVILLKEKGDSSNKNGLGRKTFLYMSRARQQAINKAKKTVKVNVAKGTAPTPAPSALTVASSPTPEIAPEVAPVVAETEKVESNADVDAVVAS